MILRTKSLKQSKMMCGPASLKIVADYFGIQASEKKLARLCRASRTIGTTGNNLLAGAQAIGLEGKIIDGAGFKDINSFLHRGIPVIVDWFSPGQSRPVGKSRMADGHYSVVVGLTSTHITLEDPGIGQKRNVRRRDFMRVWFDFEGTQLKKRSSLILQRMIVIVPEKLRHDEMSM